MSMPCAQGRAACSHVIWQGVWLPLLRAGMTSVGVGCVTREFIVNVCGGLVSLSTCVFAWAPCLVPLRGKKFSRRRRPCWHSCCIVVFSLHLEFSGWGRRKGKWLAAFQETWASALWKEKKDTHTDHIGYSCCVAPREPQPPMLPGVPHLTWADSELVWGHYYRVLQGASRERVPVLLVESDGTPV